MEIHVRVESRSNHGYSARMQAIETMISHRHVALGTAPPAFVLVEYGGSLTESLASSFPHSTLVSVEESALLPSPARPNFFGCATKMSLTRLASLQLANIVVEYQIVWRLLAELPLERERDLATVLRGLVTAARWTLLEVDAPLLAHMHTWYGHGDVAAGIRAALAGMSVGLALLSATGATPAHVLVRHLSADTAHTPNGEPLCRRLADLLLCAPSALASAAGQTSLCRVKELETTPTPTKRATPSRAHTTKHRLRPIPTNVCGQAAGLVVEIVKACIEKPRNAQLWTYENDGWYKCRNATHWLSGCQRLL